MQYSLAQLKLPLHRRIAIRQQAVLRADHIGQSISQLDCPLLESADYQPNLADIIMLSARLRCRVEFTDLRLIPNEEYND